MYVNSAAFHLEPNWTRDRLEVVTPGGGLDPANKGGASVGPTHPDGCSEAGGNIGQTLKSLEVFVDLQRR